MPQNGINYAGVMALASAMRHNRELRVLNFNDNTFTKKGALAMAQVGPGSGSAQEGAERWCWCLLSSRFLCCLHRP